MDEKRVHSLSQLAEHEAGKSKVYLISNLKLLKKRSRKCV
jgi:hypothetical protein